MSTANPSIAQLQRAIQISEQIERLEAELKSILSGTGGSVVIGPSVVKGPRAKGKRTMSPEARERIAAAQRARWAKSKGAATGSSTEASPAAKPAKRGKKKRTMSPEARARIVAAQKRRWAAFKKSKK